MMPNALKELLDDIAISMALFFHNCKTLIDIEEWPKEDVIINTNALMNQIDISNPRFDPQKEFDRFKSFIEEFREHTNKFYGNKIFNLAEYYIWSLRYTHTDDVILIDIWEKAKLIKKKRGSKNHWEIKEPKTCTQHGQSQSKKAKHTQS